MNWWIQKQLRAILLTDLRPLIPEGYFESQVDTLTFNKTIDVSGHLSDEIRWGYLAGTLGKQLFFSNIIQMSARQKSASDVLMNLGMYVGAYTTQQSCNKLTELADKQGASDGNAKKVALQIHNEQLPVLERNVNGALAQYLRHLSKEEASPFIPLLNRNQLIALGFKTSNLKRVISWVMEHIVSTIIAGFLLAAALAWAGLS